MGPKGASVGWQQTRVKGSEWAIGGSASLRRCNDLVDSVENGLKLGAKTEFQPLFELGFFKQNGWDTQIADSDTVRATCISAK